MEKIAVLLKQTELLDVLSMETIQRYIVPQGTHAVFEKGQLIFSAQEKVDTVQIILSGKVSIAYLFADGNYCLADVETPLHVLALDLVATRTRIAPYFTAATEPTELFSFPIAMILEHGILPERDRLLLLNRLLLMVAQSNMKKEYRLAILSRHGLRERIMTYLSMQAIRLGMNTFEIPFSRDELAAFLCVNRSALSHALSQMRQERLIDFHKNRFTLLIYDSV